MAARQPRRSRRLGTTIVRPGRPFCCQCYFVVPEVPLMDPELDDGGVVDELDDEDGGVVDDVEDEGDDELGDDEYGASSCVRLQAATNVKLRRESATAAKVGILISSTFWNM